MAMTHRGHYILIVVTALFPITCFTSYTIAVLLNHVHAWFPYISDTGTRAPESCVFGFFMGIYALLTAKVIRIRYQQVSNHYGDSNRRAVLIINKIALVTGWAAALGIYIVGNFQETNVIVMHLIGAFLAFFVGNVYMWLQTILSYKTRLLPGYSPGLTRLRLVLAILNTLGIVVFLIFAAIASKLQPNDPLKWGPGVKGFTEHVVSTFLEWVVAFIATAFFLTFSKEFHKFEIKGEELNFLDDGSQFELGGKNENGDSSSTVNGEMKY